MTYTVGDGYKFKMRLSQGCDAALSVATELLRLAAEALEENDGETSTAILLCSREIREAVKRLRRKTL